MVASCPGEHAHHLAAAQSFSSMHFLRRKERRKRLAWDYFGPGDHQHLRNPSSIHSYFHPSILTFIHPYLLPSTHPYFHHLSLPQSSHLCIHPSLHASSHSCRHPAIRLYFHRLHDYLQSCFTNHEYLVLCENLTRP